MKDEAIFNRPPLLQLRDQSLAIFLHCPVFLFYGEESPLEAAVAEKIEGGRCCSLSADVNNNTNFHPVPVGVCVCARARCDRAYQNITHSSSAAGPGQTAFPKHWNRTNDFFIPKRRKWESGRTGTERNHPVPGQVFQCCLGVTRVSVSYPSVLPVPLPIISFPFLSSFRHNRSLWRLYLFVCFKIRK